MKFDGYIYFFSEEGGGDYVLVLHKKRKKDEKREEKIKKKCLRWVTSDKRFGSLFPFCIQNKNKITTS